MPALTQHADGSPAGRSTQAAPLITTNQICFMPALETGYTAATRQPRPPRQRVDATATASFGLTVLLKSFLNSNQTLLQSGLYKHAVD